MGFGTLLAGITQSAFVGSLPGLMYRYNQSGEGEQNRIFQAKEAKERRKWEAAQAKLNRWFGFVSQLALKKYDRETALSHELIKGGAVRYTKEAAPPQLVKDRKQNLLGGCLDFLTPLDKVHKVRHAIGLVPHASHELHYLP